MILKFKNRICFIFIILFVQNYKFLAFKTLSNLSFDKDLKPEQIVTNNWLQITKKKWPEIDKRTSNIDLFYFFHSEKFTTSPQFTLKLDVFEKSTVVSDIDLSFDYWTDDADSTLRTIQKSIYKKCFLNITSEWQSVKLTNIKLKDWENFAFFNPNAYTIAFKNIKVTFTEKILLSSLPASPVHRYQDTTHIKTENLSFFAQYLDIRIKEKTIEISKNTFFEFYLRVPELNVEEKIKILLNKQNECVYQIEIEISEINIHCWLNHDRKNEKFYLDTVTIGANKKHHMLIKMIEVFNFKADIKLINIRPFVNNLTEKRLIYLVDSQPDNLDVCYKISKHQFSEVVVYLTFANQNNGKKLLTIERLAEQEFCINHYFALKNLKQFQLTFEIPSKKENNHHESPDAALYIARRTIDNTGNFPSFDILQPWSKPFDANFWLFSNPHFDYSFNGTNVQNLYGMEHPQFKICDATANCFKINFSFEKNKTTNKEISIYTIPEVAKTIFKTSPYVKIDFFDKRPLDPNDINKDRSYFDKIFDFGYSKATFVMLDLLKVAIASANPSFKTFYQPGFHNITFSETISSIGQIKIKIPLNSVDFRIYILKATVQTQTNYLILDKVYFILDNFKSKNDLTELIEVQQSSKSFTLSTDTFIYLPTHTINPSVPGTLTLTVSGKASTLVEIIIELVATNMHSKSLKLLPISINSQNMILNSNNSKTLIRSKLIRSWVTRVLPDFKIKFHFHTLFSNIKISNKDILLTQIVVSQGVVEKLLQPLTFNKSSATFENSNKINKQTKLYGPAFEIIYLIELKNKNIKIIANLEQFEILSPTINANILKQTPYFPLADPRYDCFICPENYEYNKINRSCTWAKTYRISTLTCKPPYCLNLFNTTFLPSKIYASYNQESIYFPYQTNSFVDPFTNYLQISRPKSLNKNSNFCFEFSYLAKENPLMISASKNNKKFYQIEFSKTYKNIAKQAFICANQLNPNVTNVNSIFFRFMKSQINYQVHQIQNFKMIPSLLNESNILSEGIYLQKLTANQFWYFDPHFVSFIAFNNSIKFEINELQARKVFKSEDIVVTTISSKWITVPSSISQQFRMTIKPEISQQDENLYNIWFSVSTPHNNEIIKKSFLEINSETINIFSFPLHVKEYQLTIKIEFNVKKVTFQDISTVTFSSLSINDPCLKNVTKINNCSNNGYCVRDYKNFSPVCKCFSGYFSYDCSKIDSCKTTMVDSLTKVKYTNKERYCQSKKCKNMLEFESFSCECESGKKWDHVNKKCIPQITECLENQIFTISEFGKGSCRCIKGFVMNLTTNNCESFDVCNENHRMMLSITPIKPCNDLHAKCISSNDSSFFEYECVCKTGYYSEFGATSALATVCKANECKNCAHFCKNVNHTFECSCSIGYSLTSSGGCVPNKGFNVSECFFNSLLNQPAPFINNNGKCQCIENFIFKKQTKTCQPDLKLIKIFNCATKKIEIKNDHFLGCKCAFGQAFNYKNRNCLQKCDIQAVNDCATNHHAECQFVDNKTKCLCKKNQIAFSTSNNSTYFKCIDKCTTFLQMPENEKFQCSSKFSVCDSTLFEFDQYSTNSKMFIANFSQIMSKNHCQCEIGFEKDISTNQCKLSNQPLKIIKNIEFIGNLKTLKNIRTAFEQFMKSFFLTLKFYSFDCHIFKQNDKVICSATFQSYKDEVSIKNLFNLACIGITNLKSKQQCVYLTKNFELVQKILIDKNTQDTKLLSAVLIRPNNKTKFVIENFNYCKNKNRCDVFTNSICQSITLQTQNTFKCLCNLKYFNVLNSQMIGSIELQYCAPKNFCDSKNPYCLDQTAQCHSIVEKNIDNSFSSLIFCVCPNNITLPSQMHNCSSACISNFCKNGGICVQDIYNLENISCKCLEGFNGPFCDLKIEKTNNSKIFLYTTILISFIAFFAVIGMCFLYFKKTKL